MALPRKVVKAPGNRPVGSDPLGSQQGPQEVAPEPARGEPADAGLEGNAVWSPDGAVFYFISDRDGFRCLWGQRLDRVTKRPMGESFAAHHFHQARRSLMTVTEPGIISLNVTRDRMFFSMPERTGNIWLAELK